MKLNKIFLMGLMASAALLTACSDDDDHDYKRGAAAGAYDVTFVSDEHITMGFTDTSFDVELYRPDSISQEALTVPVEVVSKPDFVSVPSEVTFAAGDSIATLTVAVGEGMEAFKDYTLSIRVPEQYTNPYSEQDGTPSQNIIFNKEDYQLFATATFAETVLFKDEWDIEIQYSPMLDLYRVPDALMPGTAWYFHWNGPDAAEQEFYFTDSEGKKASCTVGSTKYHGWYSGYTHKSYGQIFVTVLDGYFYGYNPDDQAIYFPVAYRVSDGSFGSDFEYFYNIQYAQ